MTRLTLMMGCPGAGKSTYAKNHLNDNEVYVSRDEIRFSMIGENEEYFSKEKEVYKKFVETINSALKEGKSVIADATHLNPPSRHKLLSNIHEHVDEINILWIQTSLETALKRNENRKGTRAYVPKSALRRMYLSMLPPSPDEGFDYIYFIDNEDKE